MGEGPIHNQILDDLADLRAAAKARRAEARRRAREFAAKITSGGLLDSATLAQEATITIPEHGSVSPTEGGCFVEAVIWVADKEESR